MILRRGLLAAAGLALGLALGAAGTARAGQTFDTVKARGILNCGVNVGVAGFSLPDSQGVWRGMTPISAAPWPLPCSAIPARSASCR